MLGNNVIDSIYGHMIGIDRPLRRTPIDKCSTRLTSKITQRLIGKSGHKEYNKKNHRTIKDISLHHQKTKMNTLNK